MEKSRFIGSGKQRNEKYINISICISDINQNDLTEYNGKKYLKLTVGRKDQPDQYGKTHWVKIDDYKPEK